jgi:hypothetical protein
MVFENGKYCLKYNNTVNLDNCVYYCNQTCILSMVFTFLFLIWFCWSFCSLCIKYKVRNNIMYYTGLRQINDCENDELLESGGLVVVGKNIEKPPEYIE